MIMAELQISVMTKWVRFCNSPRGLYIFILYKRVPKDDCVNSSLVDDDRVLACI